MGYEIRKAEFMLMLRVSAVVLLCALSGLAQERESSSPEKWWLLPSGAMAESDNVPSVRSWHVAMNSGSESSFPASSPQASSRPKAITYSNGYLTRNKIHRYASFATLPLFAAEAVVGQKLYSRNNVSGPDSLRSAHSGLAAGIGVLFGVNSVTGIWNMLEARKNPDGRGKRLFHGILMLTSDAGFVATAALAPHRERGSTILRGSASTHRAVAFSSIGIATVGYVYMLLSR